MAIGDGYNDTQMLEAADCGIRIRKPEVKQANGIQKKAVVAEGDFIIINFFQVQKLLLAHGFHSQHQIKKLIKFYFYKNILLVGCEITFQFFCGFSKQRFFISLLTSAYNLVLSTLQSLIAILFEHRKLRENLQTVPLGKY